MVAFLGKLIVVIIFFLSGTSAAVEVPVSFPTQDSIAHTQTIAAADNAVTAGMQWQILPGEDILQIARLMFPKNSVARDTFIRAIIRTNPEHFPDQIYRSLPSGAIIHIPDLRIIGAYAKPAAKTRKPSTASGSTGSESQTAPETAISGLNNNHSVLQLITQLEQVAENEARELNMLIKRIESLELRIAEIQSTHVLKIQEPGRQQTNSTNIPLETNIQSRANSMPLNETSDVPVENQFTFGTVFVLGVLLTVLVIIMILRNYRRIQERLLRSADALLHAEVTDRHQYNALFLRRSDKSVNPAENWPDASSQTVSEAHSIIKQGNPEAAVQFLQKQLSINRFDVPGWILLFELLYTSGSKTDFKKNARRFKRLGEFPDIWVQIQNLGHRLEPDEPLYFDEQKRKEKFFPDSSDFD